MSNSNTAFLITAFDQLREVKFTIKMLRQLWRTTQKSPIVLVISGDYDRTITFNDDPYTRVVHVDDMVGPDFKTLVSTSIMRQIEHGMLEIKDLERQHGRIDNIVHMHGDILLLSEKGFFKEIERWKATGKPIAADNVGAQNPVVKNIGGKEWKWKFYGCELMPQLFVVDQHFAACTGFMYDMTVIGDLEKKATEWALIGNLHRAMHHEGSGHALRPVIDPLKDKSSPYQFVFDKEVHVVKRNRAQWGLHSHWGGFCHFGNSLHYTKEQRETRNEAALRQYGIDLESW
jgi:hypothetical protein